MVLAVEDPPSNRRGRDAAGAAREERTTSAAALDLEPGNQMLTLDFPEPC